MLPSSDGSWPDISCWETHSSSRLSRPSVVGKVLIIVHWVEVRPIEQKKFTKTSLVSAELTQSGNFYQDGESLRKVERANRTAFSWAAHELNQTKGGRVDSRKIDSSPISSGIPPRKRLLKRYNPRKPSIFLMDGGIVLEGERQFVNMKQHFIVDFKLRKPYPVRKFWPMLSTNRFRIWAKELMGKVPVSWLYWTWKLRSCFISP